MEIGYVLVLLIPIAHAFIAKKLGVNPILGFVLGCLCPGISLAYMLAVAKRQ